MIYGITAFAGYEAATTRGHTFGYLAGAAGLADAHADGPVAVCHL